MKEIIVLQAGGNTNRLFVPFWNIQHAYLSAGTEAPLSEVLWTSKCTPHLLALDHKDQLCLPGLSAPRESLPWSGALAVYTQQPIHSWSSDLSFPITSHSVVAADEDSKPREELEERLRALGEQCDCVQGAVAGCDWDWMWAGGQLVELFGDACPKLPICLQTFKPLTAPQQAEMVGKYLADLADFSHLLHIPAIWDDYTDNLQRFAPALFAENMSVPCRIAASCLDLRLLLQPLLLNSASNLATAVINSPATQMTLGIAPTQCSLSQRWARGRGSDVAFPIPALGFTAAEEYETICARTSAFSSWVTGLADSVIRLQRDDEGREIFNKLQAVADLYT